MARSTKQELEEAQERIAEGLKTLPESYVECRGMLHAWKVQNDFRIITPQETGRRGPRFLRRDLKCMRGCGTVRRDTFLLRFVGGEPMISQKLNSAYSYPEGYQIPGIPRGVKRQVVVYQEQFRRASQKNKSLRSQIDETVADEASNVKAAKKK